MDAAIKLLEVADATLQTEFHVIVEFRGSCHFNKTEKVVHSLEDPMINRDLGKK